jgi:hypothetical protein
MDKNGKPEPEDFWLWSTWYTNAASRVQPCPCRHQGIDLGTSLGDLQKSFRGWRIAARCLNGDCKRCGAGGVGLWCKGELRLKVPVINVGTINRQGTEVILETWLKPKAPRFSKDTYKFLPIAGMGLA